MSPLLELMLFFAGLVAALLLIVACFAPSDIAVYPRRKASVVVFLGRTHTEPHASQEDILSALHINWGVQHGWPMGTYAHVVRGFTKAAFLEHVREAAAATSWRIAFVFHGHGFYSRSSLYFLPSGAVSGDVHSDLVSLQEIVDIVAEVSEATELMVFLVATSHLDVHSDLAALIPNPQKETSSARATKGKAKRSGKEACMDARNGALKVFVRAVGKAQQHRQLEDDSVDPGEGKVVSAPAPAPPSLLPTTSAGVTLFPGLALAAFETYKFPERLWTTDAKHLLVPPVYMTLSGEGDSDTPHGEKWLGRCEVPLWRWPYAENGKIQFGETFHFAILVLFAPRCAARLLPCDVHLDQLRFFEACARTSRVAGLCCEPLARDLEALFYFSHNQGTKALFQHREEASRILQRAEPAGRQRFLNLLLGGAVPGEVVPGEVLDLSGSGTGRLGSSQFVVVRHKPHEAEHLNTPERMVVNRLAGALKNNKFTILLGELGVLNHLKGARTRELLEKLEAAGLLLDMTGLSAETLEAKFSRLPLRDCDSELNGLVRDWLPRLLELDLFRLQLGAWGLLTRLFNVQEAHGIWSGGLDALALLGIRVYRYVPDIKMGKVKRIEMWHEALGLGKPILCAAELRQRDGSGDS